MGKAMSVLVRANQRFNIETRAQRVLSAEKPKPAPKYEANLRELERTLQENPEIVEKLSKKNEKLDGHLKQVFVRSQREIVENTDRPDTERPLPLARGSTETFEFGYREPQKTPAGKVTMRNVLEFLNEHYARPETYTADQVAAEYKLSVEDARNILTHYKMLSLHVNDPRQKKLPDRDVPQPMIEGDRLEGKGQ